MSDLPVVILKLKSKENIRHFHPWIYSSEIAEVKGECADGDLVCVKSPKGSVVGWGYINRKSQITVRILDREEFAFDGAFVTARLRAAMEFRKGQVRDTNAYRVVCSEGDFMPGLIVDKYDDVAVVQFLTLGVEKRRDTIIGCISEVLSPKRIYDRSDVNVRKHEGLEPRKGWAAGAGDTIVEIIEGGVKYLVDIANGHKTGFYLDQRDNRRRVRDYMKGKDLLDCFTYTGSFAVAAAKAGARSVLGIDISGDSAGLARKNAGINGVSNRCEFMEMNVFDALKSFEKEGRRFDAVFLDPPTFTKSKAAVDEAYRGYKEINLRAMKILNAGGYLLTSTCSHHVSAEMFKDMLTDAANDARKTVRLLFSGTQSADHPVILSIPETEYLKALFVQIV